MLELVFACFIGILIGTLTGMIPGIHVNTAGAILFASSAFILGFLSPEFLCVLMVSMSIAHALTEFVPSMLWEFLRRELQHLFFQATEWFYREGQKKL